MGRSGRTMNDNPEREPTSTATTPQTSRLSWQRFPRRTPRHGSRPSGSGPMRSGNKKVAPKGEIWTTGFRPKPRSTPATHRTPVDKMDRNPCPLFSTTVRSRLSARIAVRRYTRRHNGSGTIVN